jgi:hypothetical protein
VTITVGLSTLGKKAAVATTSGQVTGLRLDDYSNTWNYTLVFDYPQGFCEEFIEEDLAAFDELLCSKL